ncbi:uncharacterized protein LOC129579209 isoform X2 [Sitodiplosis mosellana]|uniref:uncharacterized protein LOC129579209 isoform X2 n=1 Tax=Sitodiplosis mosellana TaxID=263140 RepID=UPI0024444982|nr:uncharacterized protein LOC129579209 isoform X2 [Sitodiplosis mosellana]
MDTPSKHLLSNSGDDLNQSTMSHGTSFGESSFAADDSQFSSNHGTLRSSFDKESSKSGASSSRPPPAKTPQKKNVLELFPWLNDIEKSTQKCLGSINEVKSRTVLNAMDFLIRKLAEDYQKYCKSPRLSIILARYLREFLYSYRHLYKGFDLGKEYFRRVTKILAAYTDLELCGSVSGLEWDTEMANRIQLIYRIHLEFAEDFTVLDIFINMKRLSRVHRGVLTLLLKHFLVKITVKEPVEVEDDVFVKYLIVFKKWLAIEDIYEDKEDIRSAFTTQAKPKSTLCMNSKYAPYLPADEDGSTITNKYVRMLDKKFSFQPLLRALEVTEKVSGEPSTSGVARKINEVVVLSDDEEDASELQLVTVKTEISENSDNLSVIDQTSKPDLIDLTDEAFEDADVPRHYISWLTDLIKRAKVVPTTMDQRLEGASISHDVIVIDDPEENSEANKNPTDESQTTKIAPVNVSTVSTNVTHTNSPSMDSGCVLSNREEVGIHWNSNFEMCPSSQNEVRVDGTPADNQLCQPEQASHGNVVITNHSNDDNSMECNAFNVSSSDGNNRSLPINVVASGSISSCSDEAAEQLLTVALKNQKLNDRLPTSDLIDKVQMTKDSTSNRSINNKVSEPSDVDCTVESTSLSLEPTSSDSLPQPSHIPEPSTVCRRLQVVSDKNLTVNFDKKHVDDEISRSEDSGVASESVSGGGEPLDDYNAKVIRSQAKKSVTVVHPTRHKPHNTIDSETGDDFPQDMTSLSSSSSQKHFECSIPLSSIKTNNLFAKTVDNRSPTRATQHVIVESTADNSQAVANATSLSRRRIGEKTEIVNDNEHVPSTIMERKTYIKKTYNNKTISTGNRSLTTTKPPTQLTKSPTSSSSSSSLTIESRQQQVAITPHATSEQQHISPSKTTQTQHQPYKLFYSGTDLDLGLNDIGSPLSECASPGTNTLQSLTSAFCESDNNLIHNSNVTMKLLNGPTSSLPSAIVHPLGLEQHSSKHSTKLNVKPMPEKASLIDTLTGTNAALISNDERSSVEDHVDSCDNLSTVSSNSEGELDMKYKPEYMLQIYKELGDHLKTMGYKPENEVKTKTRTKRLMNAASRFLEAEDINAANYSPEPIDENDEGDASLPFKKRRKLPVFSDTIIKEEEFDSQPPFESPGSVPSVQCEIEIASERVSYPPTPMLSIANIVEYLPFRAYSTFKTPAPEIAPVRFNILPQPAMVINNASTPNVMGTTNATVPPPTGSSRAPQQVEFETTFNLIPSQQNIATNQTNPMSSAAPPNVVTNTNMNCGIVAPDGEQYLGPIAGDNGTNGFNVTQYHHQPFHPNSPYAATYSIQPTHTNPNSLPQNFDIQNMFNLHNYQMNPQHYHNLLQNSRINFQEKKSILLNDYVNSINEGGGQEGAPQNHHQHHQHQHQQQQQQHLHQHQSQTHQNIMQTPVDTKSPSINKPMAPRTKAARKMVVENVTVAAISSNDKLMATKSNRVTRSSIRTTRAQNVSSEQKSPRRKTNRHR